MIGNSIETNFIGVNIFAENSKHVSDSVHLYHSFHKENGSLHLDKSFN